MPERAPVIGIVMGSKSDVKVMQGAVEMLERMEIPHEVFTFSAHRNPARAEGYAIGARARGIKVIIAGAGLAAALPGMLAAHTTLPVIGVPINAENSFQGGTDAVCGILQMPPGVPVAAVGINNAVNAALLAAAILAVENQDIAKAITEYRAQWNQ